MTTPPILLTELAERVEKLTGPCRDTDVAIWAAITPADTWRRVEPGKSYSTWQIRDGAEGEWRDYYPSLNARLYTESLDAAMTLVPEGLDIEMSRDAVKPAGKLWCVYLSAGDPVQTKFIPILTRGDTGPLALVAASLRARAASESPHG